MNVVTEPMKDHSISSKADLKWTSSVSSRSIGSTTDASSCCGSVRSFADDERLSEKRVRFTDMSRQRNVLSHNFLSPSDKNRLWYNERQSEQIRTQAKRSAIKACTGDAQYARGLNQLCKDVCALGASMDDYEIYSLLTDADFLCNMAENLNDSQSSWQDEDTYRGLEDLISDERRFVRFDVGEEARAMVVETSKQSKTTSAEETARYYTDMSMSAVVLARITAVADEAAAEEVYDDWE